MATLLIAVFIVGFVQDILGAYYLRLITEKRIFMATFVSFVHNLIAWAMTLCFIHAAQNTMGVAEITVYSLGGAMGTALALRGIRHNTEM